MAENKKLQGLCQEILQGFAEAKGLIFAGLRRLRGDNSKLANSIPTAKSAESHRGVNPMSWKRAWAEQPLFHYSTIPTSRLPPFHSSGSGAIFN